ncbi:hypothetical protein BZG36_02868 [Bifiguratus adelaidae]|uniref:Cystathionine gamma-synthase n=1 Tax=Bifiguratus adelaidae TaxID=1938954 RepID=A0A261Y0F8_9FUNG|nr:hypothetical protein BZG36_02868 [Bifiguratus adelaidae]
MTRDTIETLESSFSTLALHADDEFAFASDVAPGIGVSTTFRMGYVGAVSERVGPNGRPNYIYSRDTTNNRDRLEIVLGKLTEGHAVTYASGQAAGFAALVHYKPRRVAIRGGYHGTHGSLKVYNRHHAIDVIDIDDPYEEGDLVWIESPHNPEGEIFGNANAKIIVDATFAPPPLSYPFRLGVDLVMHSTSKYFSGHSDGLGGLLVAPSAEQATELREDRVYLGSVLGSLETWLLLRSVRTLKVRVVQQSITAEALARWLNGASGGKAYDGIPAKTIHSVRHASLQDFTASPSPTAPGQEPKPSGCHQGWDVAKQNPGGFGACFSVLLYTSAQARKIPFTLTLHQPATSLGGVESLIEWRYGVDPSQDERLVRVSIGLEELDDLKEDWRRGLKRLVYEE